MSRVYRVPVHSNGLFATVLFGFIYKSLVQSRSLVPIVPDKLDEFYGIPVCF